jgi:hypothetical protein
MTRPAKRAAIKEPSNLEQRPSPEVMVIAGVPLRMLVIKADEIPTLKSPSTDGRVSWINASLSPGPKIRDMSETAFPLHRAVGNRDSITQQPKKAADLSRSLAYMVICQ